MATESPTLVHNWYEERLAPVQPSTLDKTLRESEDDLALVHDRFDVLDCIPRCKQPKSEVLADDGKWVDKSLTTVDFAHPKTRRLFVANPPEMPQFVNHETIPEMCHDGRRPVEGEDRGFGAVLDRHADQVEVRYFDTTHGQTYGMPGKTMPETSLPTDGHSSGLGVIYASERGEGIQCSELTGEMLKPEADPSENTHVQRAWMYAADPALVALNNSPGRSTRPAIPRQNNHMSLPLGEGDHKVTSALRDSKGMLYRQKTEITTGSDTKYGVNIWKDCR